MKIEINCRFSGKMLFAHEAENNTLKITAEAAVKVRANLAGANLDGAYLARANLDGEVLTKAPISLLNLTWPVLITEKFLRIGCQRHAHAEWAGFSDEEIAVMESRAAQFWSQWGDVLLSMCAKHAEIK